MIMADQARLYQLGFVDSVYLAETFGKTAIKHAIDSLNEPHAYDLHSYWPEDPVADRHNKKKPLVWGVDTLVFGSDNMVFNRYLGYYAEDYNNDTGLSETVVNAATAGFGTDETTWDGDIVVINIPE